jgi:geranylgeranyl pyrophosphate synthase
MPGRSRTWVDLLEAKRTLMLIHLLRTLDGDDRERVRLYLGKRRRERTDEEVRWLRRLLDDRGSLEFARGAAIGLARAALAEGEAVLRGVPDSEDKDFLLEAARYVIERDR